ncbi:ABC transporter permease [Pseudotenacibaculum sp. MALMAid0570]|uniref:ABC transporter permease n=1 Tax=Pseudotenacibaculum sp. MALMAid0570 TaxID=3143938 RepID=UPI0032DE3E38
MSKLKLIIQREFRAKVKNKSFIVMTFLSPLLMVGIGFLIFFLSKKNSEKIKTIAYVNQSQLFEKTDFKDRKTVKYEDYSNLTLEEAKDKVKNGDFYGLIYIPKQDSLELLASSIEFYSNSSPSVGTIESIERKVERKLRDTRLNSLHIDREALKSSEFNANIKLNNFSGEKSSKMGSWIKIGAGAISGYFLMMFVIIYGTSVMRSVIEEKTSRIIEVIVSSVKPFQLMLGKIIGNASAGLLQFFIWGVIMMILSIVASSIFGVDMMEAQTSGMTPEQLEVIKQESASGGEQLFRELQKLPLLKMFFLFIFYFLGGYFLYSSVFAAVGAAVDNETDTQQFMLPIMLPLILGVYIGFATVIDDPNGPISTIFSIIPLTSPIVMLMRVPFGVPWYEILISMALLLITFVFMVWFAAKIYRVGILMYGKKPTYKDLYKWLKYKG